jgi:hypothetical protein
LVLEYSTEEKQEGVYMIKPRGLSLSISLAVSVLLTMGAGVALADDDSVRFKETISPPNTTSFDIGWVENSTGRYFLADRTNNAVDLINAKTDTFIGAIGKGVFKGNTGSRTSSGPNGVLTDNAGLVWAGDGDSSIKVLNPTPGTTDIKSLATGGTERADELSYDPKDGVILIANDFEGFLTFINVPGQSVAGHFYYADNTVDKTATVPGHSTPGGGIEQSVWDPRTRLFYQALPANSPTTVGLIDVFDPVTEKLVDTISVPGCTNGPTGLALNDNKFLGACDNGAAVVNLRARRVERIVPDVGGADEVWFNPGDGNFYLGISGPPAKLGVVDGNNHKVIAVLTGKGGHSVAAYAGNNRVFDPDRNGTGIFVFQGERR